LLEVEFGHGRYETTNAAISQLDASNQRPYTPHWTAEFDGEIGERESRARFKS